MSTVPLSSEFVPQSSKIPVLELIPYCGCVCCVTSLYTDFPDCIGCAGSRICLCCYSEYSALKMPMDGDPIWCHWDKGRTYCAPSSTFCMFYYKDTCGPFECFRTVKELDECAAQLAQPSQYPPHGHPPYPPQQQPYAGQPYNPQNYPPQQYPPQQYPPQQYPPQQYYAPQGPPGQPYPPQQYPPQQYQQYPPQQQQAYTPPPMQPHQNQPPPEQYVPQQTTASPLAPPVVSE